METPRQTGHTQAWVFSRTHLNTALVQSEPHLKPSALRIDRSGWRGLPLPALSPKLNKLPVCQGLGHLSRPWFRGASTEGPPGQQAFHKRQGPAAPKPQGQWAHGRYLNTWRMLLTRRSMTLSVSSREQLSRCSWSWLRLREVTRPCTGMTWVQRGPLRSRKGDKGGEQSP